jgi:Xaa-Pro aminopeptidase
MGTTPILLYGDTVRAPALRHEVPLAIVDPFLLVEVDGRRVAFVVELELPRVAELEGLETLTTEALGIAELRARMPQQQAAFEVVRRACVALGVSDAVVPGDFPLALARALEAAGIGLEPRDDVCPQRGARRRARALRRRRLTEHSYALG